MFVWSLSPSSYLWLLLIVFCNQRSQLELISDIRSVLYCLSGAIIRRERSGRAAEPRDRRFTCFQIAFLGLFHLSHVCEPLNVCNGVLRPVKVDVDPG